MSWLDPFGMWDSGNGYDQAAKQYSQGVNKGVSYLDPYAKAGAAAIPEYQNWLKGMSNPSEFINNTMNQYQQSPWAQNMMRDSNRAATNYGSATGLTGSTPLMQQIQQNAGNISSQDMGNWLSNVLGINSQYGAGEQGLINQGSGSANSIASLFSGLGQNKGEAAYGANTSRQNQIMQMLMMGMLI